MIRNTASVAAHLWGFTDQTAWIVTSVRHFVPAELIIYLIDRFYLCWKCLTPVTIQYLRSVASLVAITRIVTMCFSRTRQWALLLPRASVLSRLTIAK